MFGSNLAGKHVGGAARQAFEQFGAVSGVGEGLVGQSYAFPTLGWNMEQLDTVELEASRDHLFETAKSLPAVIFYLTKVGCGIAGFEESKMKQLFTDSPSNLLKPEGWQ